MSHQPNNIFAGTQVVALLEVRGPNNSLVHPQVALRYPDGWPIWNDLKDYVKSGRATLHELLVNLNFELLD